MSTDASFDDPCTPDASCEAGQACDHHAPLHAPRSEGDRGTVKDASDRLSAWTRGETVPTTGVLQADCRTVLQSFAGLEAALDGARANVADVAELVDLDRSANGLAVRNAVAAKLSEHRRDREEVAYVCDALARDLESSGGWPSVSRATNIAEALRRAERFLVGSQAPADRPTVETPDEAAPGSEGPSRAKVAEALRRVENDALISDGIYDVLRDHAKATLASAEDALASARRSEAVRSVGMADRGAALKAVRLAYNADEVPNAEDWTKLAEWLLTGSTGP